MMRTARRELEQQPALDSAGPLVSIIIPTRNSAGTIGACLDSIRSQQWSNIEIIVVDNFSEDQTRDIATAHGATVYVRGPERSAQVNFGVKHARGEFVYKVDSDFVLEPAVVKDCMALALAGADAVVVHNTPDSTVSWIARVRKFEVDMYKYDLMHSSARFTRRDIFERIGGFSEDITAGEDYDFQNKLNRIGAITMFAEAEAIHIGEPTRLLPHLRKYYAYGTDFIHYVEDNPNERYKQLTPFRSVYRRHASRFIESPRLGALFLLYTALKFSAAGGGFTIALARQWLDLGPHQQRRSRPSGLM